MVVHETSTVIWKKPQPTVEKWKEVSSLWNLPNYIGSIDGKHIRIKCPPRSGSAYFNYKGYFSTVLLVVSDADGMLLAIDIGDYGRNSDGRVLANSNFGKALKKGNLHLPELSHLPGDDNAIFLHK